MKHENEPEDWQAGLPRCNFCDKTYDPFDVHTCPGNQIIPRKLAKVVEDEGTPPVTAHHPRCRVLQYGASDCDCGAKHKAEWDRTMQDLATVGEEIKARGALSGKALTYDDGKAPLANLPWAAIEGLSRVQAYGHGKYKDFNNYRKGIEVTRNLSCALRHIKEYLEGHDVDAESGCHPLEHAMARVAFVLQNIAEGKAIDDRYKS